MALDLNLFYFLNSLAGKSQVFDALVIFLASYSQYLLGAVFLLFLYFSAYSKRKKISVFFAVVVSPLIARVGIVEIIRFFYHRSRPFIAYQVYQLIPESGWSFPSGHSAFFFAMATVIYLYNKKLGIVFFVAATAMNISRIIAGVHYPSDILGGMIAGAATAYAVFYLRRDK